MSPGWIPRAELAARLGIGLDSIIKSGQRQGWETRRAKGRGRGGTIEVNTASLPLDMRARLAMLEAGTTTIYKGAGLKAFAQAGAEQQKRALAKARCLELLAVDLARVKGRKLTAATERFCAAFNQGLIDAEALADLGPIRSRRTLENWRKGFEAKGLDGLLDRRGRPAGSAAVPEPMQRFCWDYLLKNPQASAANISRNLPAAFPGQPLPSATTVRRLVRNLKKTHAEQLLMIHQPSLHKRLYQPSLGRADAGLTKPNQRWEADSTKGDLMGRRKHNVIEIVAQGGQRFTLIVFMDVYSRRAVALLEEKGGGHNINLCLIKAIRKLGLPLEIIMDRGKDYQSRAVQGFCADLGIHTPEIPGYMPELKPHVERFFATLQGQLFADLPGYTSNKVGNRREILLPTMSREQIQAAIDQWMERYERREHGSTGQLPLERGNPAGWTRRTVPEEQLRILLCPEDERAVRGGVIRHQGGRFYHRDLALLDGSARVLVRQDPEDAGLLHVFDLRRRFFCLAQDLARLGITPGQIARERNAFKRVRKLQRAEARQADRALDLVALNQRAAEMEIAAAPPVAEAPLEEVSFPALAEAAQARRGGGEQAPERPDSLERPAFFEDERQRYEWIMRAGAAGRPLDEADREFAARFEQSPLYDDLGGENYRQALMKGGLVAVAG